MTWEDVKKGESNSSDFMKLVEGDNKVRIVSEPEPRVQHWLGNRPIPCCGTCQLCADNVKARLSFLFYVIDRTDGEIKILGTGITIANAIVELKLSDDYSFDTIPTYDVTIKRKGQMLDTEYTVLPARDNTELTEEEKAKVEALTPLAELIKKLNEADLTRAENTPEIDRSGVANDMGGLGFVSDSASVQNEDLPF